MTELARGAAGKRNFPWRIIAWGGAIVLLAIPFVAMQLDAEGVNWTASDFIAMGVLLALVGGLFELAVRISRNRYYRAAFGLGLLGSFLLTWANLAVGIVGSEDNPANMWFFGALLIGIAGACIAHLHTKGMAAAMAATALCLWIAFGIAVSGPTDEPFVPHSRELLGTSLFAALFLASAWLFRTAARDQSSSSS
jgi:hypothetical protein